MTFIGTVGKRKGLTGEKLGDINTFNAEAQRRKGDTLLIILVGTDCE